MNEREELLRRVPMFAELDDRERRELAALFGERTFEAGERVLAEGGAAAGFFVIEEGEAVVTVGGVERTRLGRGDTFGEVALITEDARTATVTAETQLRCLGLTVWEFRPLVERNPRIAWHLIQRFAVLLREAEAPAELD
jgi:CRP/FNR family transcriptional regulator, cyclic AMP receptor protein